MRRFEFKDAKSHKFWEIQVEGDAFTVRYGKFGTDGQVQTKTFASEDKAEAEAEKLIKSKTKKGYVEVKVDAATRKQAEAKTASPGARNPELEAAIITNPDDADAWQVYFDWLQTQGDPWGERGNLALARDKAKGPAKAKLTKQIEEFDTANGEALYGKSLLALMKKDDFEQVVSLSDRYGFLWTASVRSPEYEWSGTAPNTVLGALVKSPAARLLAEIDIGLMDWEYPVSLQTGIDAISKAGKLEGLRSLFIGNFEYPDEQEISWVAVGKVGKVLPVAPNLRSLHLRGGEIDLGKLEHDTLESLLIETGGLPKSAVASIGKCNLPALTSMDVWFGRDEYGGDGNVKQLAGLLKGEGVPKLVHLGLKNCEWQDDIAVALTKSAVLAQLETVDLSMGTMHGDGAEAIIANPAKYKHLKKLDLSNNFLTEDQVARLKKALGKIVDVSGQNTPDDWGGEMHYYTSVGE
ncbi:MAG TPA: WGR domain-containing protein [Enhygromyxa sp.]|nr:WGR domain-containing protein [Enhygromyxa sp.]